MTNAGAALIVIAGLAAAQAEGQDLSLARKAEIFEYDLTNRFMLEGQVMSMLRPPTPETAQPGYSMSDNAYLTGVYAAVLSMKYALTEDPSVRAQANRTIEALDLLCTVSGRRGLLARAAVPVTTHIDYGNDESMWRSSPDQRYQWRDDASADQVTAVLFGLSMAYDLVANAHQKRQMAQNVTDLVNRIYTNDTMLTRYDGTPTTWGRYFPDYVKKRMPLNALLLLQHAKIAHYMTNDRRLQRKYLVYALQEHYDKTSIKAHHIGPPGSKEVHYSDSALIYLAYYPLLTCEKDPLLRQTYLVGLRRTWQGAEGFPGVKPEANPFYTFVTHKFLDDASMDAQAINNLRWFPFDLKWNRRTISKYEEQFGFVFSPQPQSPEPEPGEPIPFDRRPKTWSICVQNPYISGSRTEDAPVEYNGSDYLLAYWMGRYLGYIDADM